MRPARTSGACGEMKRGGGVGDQGRSKSVFRYFGVSGSGTEPVNVLSTYKYQDGLAYYESTRDVASHFFIDYLPKGTYVFEYSTRVQLRGQYQTGMAQIQCMYAPEFNSHSQSLPLTVK